MSNDDAREAFRTTIGHRLRELGGAQTWLGEELGAHLGTKAVSQSAVSAWIQGTSTPEPAVVFGLEHVLGLRPGQLSRHLGYLPVDAKPPVGGVEQAIRDDATLPTAARKALLAAVRELRRL